MSKKAILGLPLKELIGLILAAMVLVFLWYVTADLRRTFFGAPEQTPIKASFDTFSRTITRMISNDKLADSAIMPYHIAPADIKWKVDPVYVIIPFNKQEEFPALRLYGKEKDKIKAPEDCKQRVCVCSCKAGRGPVIKEDVCLNEKDSFCTVFNSEYTINFSTLGGWVGRWFFESLQKHIVNFHIIKYNKSIHVYAGIPFKEAMVMKITKIELPILPYVIEHQIGTDALRFFNEQKYEKAIFFFNEIIKHYDPKTAPFAVSKYYIAVSYNALGNYSLAKDYYEEFEKEEIKVYSKKDEWTKKDVEELKKRYNDNKFSRFDLTTNMCFLSNKAAIEKFENELYDEAIPDFSWVINNCKNINYTYEVCVANFYLGSIYKETDKEKAKNNLKEVVDLRCTNLEKIYGESYVHLDLLDKFKENIVEAEAMLEDLNS